MFVKNQDDRDGYAAGGRLPRFVCDCMLGKLARWLRVLGFDTAYFHHIEDRRLLEWAGGEKRIVLTRDQALAEAAGEGHVLLVRSDDLGEQLHQVISELGLRTTRERLFSRCIECGGPIERLPAGDAAGRVPDYVRETQDSFSTCPNCNKIYWNSTHVSAMLERLEQMGLLPE